MKKINLKIGMFSILLVVAGFFFITSHSRVNHVQVSYSKILTDKEAVANANNIIIGKVVKNLDSYEYDGKLVRTDSLIQIEKTLKGTLTGNIIFSQEGGQTKENGFVIFDNYDILSPGSEYLLFLDKFPDDYLKEYPNQAEKYISVGGPPSVYKIVGKQAKNVVQPGRNRNDIVQFEKEIQSLK